MTEQRARRAWMEIIYNGANITADVSKDLISATWNEKSSNESDDLSIKLKNTHGRWSRDWLPGKGAKIEATIITENWQGEEGIRKLPCGTFEIDEISVSAPPAQVEIKAISVPVTAKARGQSRTRAWENIKLSQIGRDIADSSGLEFFFDAGNDPEYQREDQVQEADLGFYQGLCDDAGLALKVSHDKIIVFSEKEYAKKEAVLTFKPEDLTSWKIRSKSLGIYSKCRVKYHDPENDEDIEAEFDEEALDVSGDDEYERTLDLNKRCKSIGEARELAENSLYKANKKEVEISIEIPGNISVVSGINILLEGFGAFDGKYSTTSTTHNIGGGYKTVAQVNLSEKKKGKGKDTTDYLDFDEFTKDL